MMDPLVLDMPSWVSYTYTFNNPIRLVDSAGVRPEDASNVGSDDNKILHMFRALNEVPNGLWYAGGQLKEQIFGQKTEEDIGEGHQVTSKDKIGSDPYLPKADDYKPVKDFTKASIYNVALEYLFSDEGNDEQGTKENHTWKIRTSESQDTQWFTPFDTNFQYEKPFMRVIDEDGNVEVFEK